MHNWNTNFKYTQAVDSGYWPLYRYNPTKEHPFTLESKRIKSDIIQFIDKQNRFTRLKRESKEVAGTLHAELTYDNAKRIDRLRKLALNDEDMLEYLKKQLGEKINIKPALILYGSETGTSEMLAATFASELKRREVRVKVMAMDDYDFADLPSESKVYFLISTCG